MRNLPKCHQPSTRNLPKCHQPSHAQSTQTPLTFPHAILLKRNRRGGACVPARTSAQRRFHTKNACIVRRDFNDGCALAGRHGRAHRHRRVMVCFILIWHKTCRATRAGTQAPPLPISIKHCGVPLSIVHSIVHANHTVCPLPHRGYTFDSAGLASATLPTLGNDANEDTTPLGVVLFLIAHHYHTRRMDYSQVIFPYTN